MGSLLSAATADMLARLGIDVLALLVLVGVLYRRRRSAPAMPLVFAALNIGLFAALATISAGSFKAGIGFGLFGLLSLVRLRSAAFTLKDVAFTFIALVLALVTGLEQRELLLVGFLSALLLLVVWIADDSRSEPSTRVMRLTLDHLVTDPGEVERELAHRIAAPIVGVVIDDVDFVRETTRVSVRYVAEDSNWEWAATASDSPAVSGADS